MNKIIEELKKEFPDFKYPLTKHFIMNKLFKNTCKFFYKRDTQDNISKILFRGRALIGNAKLKIKFKNDELDPYFYVIKSIINNIKNYKIQIQDNEIILWGCFKSLKLFIQNLEIQKNLEKIESVYFECFSFEEELFADALNDSKYKTNISKEKFQKLSSDFEMLQNLRNHYNFLKRNARERDFI